jgi:hypothetical protein
VPEEPDFSLLFRLVRFAAYKARFAKVREVELTTAFVVTLPTGDTQGMPKAFLTQRRPVPHAS